MNYIQFAYCIKCGLCLSACPTVATSENYTGPQSSDSGLAIYCWIRAMKAPRRREEELYSSHGVYRCHFAGACSQVCPKGVDPALAIQLAKKDAFLRSFGLRKRRQATSVAPPVQNWISKADIPKAPEPTIKQKS